MDPLIRSNVVSGGFDNLSLIKQLPRYHFLNCEYLQEQQHREWREPHAWQISHRHKSRFIFSYTTQSGVLCDMDTQRLLPCPDCVKAMNELGYMKAEITDSGHLLSLLDSNDFYTRQKAIRPSSCASVPKCLWVDWPHLSERYQSVSKICANSGREEAGCETTAVSTHYSHSDINHNNFHYLSNLCYSCHLKKPGHEYLRKPERAHTA